MHNEKMCSKKRFQLWNAPSGQCHRQTVRSVSAFLVVGRSHLKAWKATSRSRPLVCRAPGRRGWRHHGGEAQLQCLAAACRTWTSNVQVRSRDSTCHPHWRHWLIARDNFILFTTTPPRWQRWQVTKIYEWNNQIVIAKTCVCEMCFWWVHSLS